MKFCGTGGRQTRRITIPKLNGGLNGHDSGEQIEGNQLTDCMNMWWKDGALRTRPGITPLPESREEVGSQMVYTAGGGKEEFTVNDKKLRKRLAVYQVEAGAIAPALLTTDYSGNTVKSVIKSNMDAMTYGSSMLLENCGKNYDGMMDNGAIAFISPFVLKSGQYFILGEPWNPADGWVDLTDKIYVPLVMINGKGVEQGTDSEGTSVEDYNLLTGAFRCQFTSDGQSCTFSLPLKYLTSGEGETTAIKSCSVQGKELVWTIPPFEGDACQSANFQIVDETDGKRVFVLLDKIRGRIQFVTETLNPYPYPNLKVTNNIEVTAWKTIPENKRIICHMGFCTWFGGNKSGYKGGTRLFVSGNSELPNVIYWSDLNNPLYFPENNYAFVGSAGSDVTAFATQEDKLIIFKSNEIYFTQYVAGPEASGVFPITPIHPGIGCDCPYTIMLCDNHLVWANDDKKIYALSGTNSLGETNVRELSRNIDRWLAKKTVPEMRKACAGKYNGQYALLAGNDLFLFDYKEENFISYMSDSSNRQPQSKISWTRWKFDCGLTLDYMMADGENMVLCGSQSNGGNTCRFNAVLKEGRDQRVTYENGFYSTVTVPVVCLFQTKVFQFSAPECRKDIRRLFLVMTMDDESVVQTAYITEKGEAQDAAPVKKTEGGFIYRLTPNAVRVQRFGMRINSIGTIAVQDIVMNYTVYEGGIR